MKKVNWDKIEREYVRTKIGQRELAKKYKVAATQVARHSKDGEWVKKRKQFVSKMCAENKKLDEAAAVDKAKEYSKMRDSAFISQREMLRRIINRALEIDLKDENGIKDFGDAQKIIDNIITTTDKICNPSNEKEEQKITITMEGETKNYAI